MLQQHLRRGRLRLSGRAAARGELVRRAHAGAWRRAPPPPDLSADQLDEVLPLLLATGSGALVWRRVRGSALEQAHAAEALRQAYRRNALRAGVHERDLAEALAALDAAGVAALLLKGIVAARLYPEEGLRFYSDHDLCVRPDEVAAARAALASTDVRVDLHPGLGRVDGHSVWLERSFEELLASALPIEVGGVRRLAIGAEEHLVLTCLHALSHAMWRPTWLCDVAAALETRASAWDWQRCLDAAGPKREWLGAGIGLAHTVLGASLDGVPAELAGPRPRWLRRAVVARWGMHPGTVAGVGTPRTHLVDVRTGRDLGHAVRTRWPRPIEVSLAFDALPWSAPRLPLQVAVFVVGTLAFVAGLPRKVRLERRRRAAAEH